ATRFGLTGFDGGRLTLRDGQRGLELTGYAGWGLWRGSALPVTSPALNPQDEFRPPERTIVAGAGAGWTSPRVDARVSYEREVDGSGAVKPLTRLELRMQGEHYRFANSETATPLVSVESSGWRFSWGATYTVARTWAVDGAYHAEFGPGAASRGFAGGLTYASGARLSLTAHATTLDRPLEFRYDAASLDLIGLAADYRPAARLRFQLDASRY